MSVNKEIQKDIEELNISIYTKVFDVDADPIYLEYSPGDDEFHLSDKEEKLIGTFDRSGIEDIIKCFSKLLEYTKK